MAEQDTFGDFFRDPRNLATGLVFLAALAQPRQQGQSRLGAFGQAAVGGLGFRGGLEKGIRAERTAEEERQRQALSESRRQELQARQVRVQEEGLTQQATQAELGRRHERQLKTTPDALTPEQKELLRQQAGYYGRASRGGGGTETGPSEGIFDPQKLTEEFLKQRLAASIQQSSLSVDPTTGQPVAPDLAGVVKDLYAFAAPFAQIPAGTLLTREGNQVGIWTPDPRTPEGQRFVPLGGQPQSETPPVGSSTPTPITSPTAAALPPPRIRVRKPTAPLTAGAAAQPQLQQMSEEQLRNIVKNPDAEISLKKAARHELFDRRHRMINRPGGLRVK